MSVLRHAIVHFDCPECRGKGAVGTAEVVCDYCFGKSSSCPQCGGTGRVEVENAECELCAGIGYLTLDLTNEHDRQLFVSILEEYGLGDVMVSMITIVPEPPDASEEAARLFASVVAPYCARTPLHIKLPDGRILDVPQHEVTSKEEGKLHGPVS